MSHVIPYLVHMDIGNLPGPSSRHRSSLSLLPRGLLRHTYRVRVSRSEQAWNLHSAVGALLRAAARPKPELGQEFPR